MAKQDNKPFEFNENELLSSLSRDKKEIPPEVKPLEPVEDTEERKEVPKEDSRRRKVKTQDYESIYLKTSEFTARYGKAVNIRPEFHERILKILLVFTKNQATIFDYIDNVLAHHFDTLEDEITEKYNKKLGSIY